MCVVLNATVTADVNCSYNCGSDCWRVSKYPCLQVYVSLNNTGRVSRLSHNEETQDSSSEVSTKPGGVVVGGGVAEPAQMLTVDVDQRHIWRLSCSCICFSLPVKYS